MQEVNPSGSGREYTALSVEMPMPMVWVEAGSTRSIVEGALPAGLRTGPSGRETGRTGR